LYLYQSYEPPDINDIEVAEANSAARSADGATVITSQPTGSPNASPIPMPSSAPDSAAETSPGRIVVTPAGYGATEPSN
uniref:VP2 n=1 Tax=Angiostrongylus cantonensis TaxID=6313 RepID=A0A0K0DD09_ANGCA